MKELVIVVSSFDQKVWKKVEESLNFQVVFYQQTDVLNDLFTFFEKTNFEKAHFIAFGGASTQVLEGFAKKPNIFASITFSNCDFSKEFQDYQENLPDNVEKDYFEKVKGNLKETKEFLKKLNVPVLFITSEKDGYSNTSTKTASEIVTCSQLIEIKGAGHFSFLDDTKKWISSVKSFLTTSRYEPLQSLSISLSKDSIELPESTVAERLLRLMKMRGIDYVFSNSGTDFTPVIDGYANIKEDEAPEFILAPHENTTISMAHGYTLVTRRIQACMAHVHVGTANVGLGIMNACRSRTPIFVMAGRSPYYEEGMSGVRTNFVQWGQESIHQGATFREFTK